MRVAAYAGLRVAEVNVTTVGDRPILVVRRYDRETHDDGSVDRLHQEDFCQALGIPPRRKYQEDGGPPLRRIAGALQAAASDDDLDEFLRAVTLNVVLGNGDAHGKNFSLVHERSGRLRLAPLYDLLCTLIYKQVRLALYVDDIQQLERVTAERIVNEAASWGISRQRAHEVVMDILGRVPAAIAAAHRDIDGVPDEMIETVTEQLRRVLGGQPWSVRVLRCGTSRDPECGGRRLDGETDRDGEVAAIPHQGENMFYIGGRADLCMGVLEV